MTFEISWDEEALKNLEKLDILLRKRIVKKIEQFADSGSFHEVKRIQGYEHSYRLRVGHYRIIFKLEKNEIIILKFGHRKNIY